MSRAGSGGATLIGVDVGGTFTDCISVGPGGIVAEKVPTNPAAMETAVVAGVELLGAQGALALNHASTAGLNATITRRLPKVAFLTTEGHRDMLDMGRGWRPVEALTDAHWRRSFGDASRPLVPRYLRRGVRERILADGSTLIGLDEQHAREQLEVLRRCDVEGVAICLINAYVDDAHERRLAELVREVLGEVPCSISSAVSPLAKEYARASTTLIDVMMKLVFGDYCERLDRGLERIGFGGELNIADCAATLTPAEVATRTPHRVIFSGPAAGTVSSAYFGGLGGERDLICCDVGGTSSDISLVVDGRPLVDSTFEIEHDLVVNTLATEIVTLGSGGGSLVRIAPTGELRVGPESAGADPGPACYGRGGTEPTMTDACLLAGILRSDLEMPGGLRLSEQRATEAFASLETTLSLSERVRYAFDLGLNHIAEGILDATIRHGIDPRDYALVAYGSAGPMILPAILERTGVKSLVVPPFPGLFSALGLVSTDMVFSISRSAYTVLDGDHAGDVDAVFRAMERELLESMGEAGEGAAIVRAFDGRLLGQTWETPFVPVPGGTIDADAIAATVASFHDHYERRWGNRFDGMAVEGVTYRVQAVVPVEKVDYPRLERRAAGAPEPTGATTLRHIVGEPVEAPEYQRETLLAGDEIAGPAIVREALATTYVCAGQTALVGDRGELTITTDGRA